MMANKQTFPILDVVATIFASAEHQLKLANQLNPGHDISTAKPSEKLYIPTKKAVLEGDTAISYPNTNDPVYLPSLTSYTKFSLNMDSKWLDENSEVVTVTDQHRDDARAAMDTITNKVMLMVLKGTAVNGFIGSLSKLIEQEEVSGRDIGLLTYVPKTARQYAETDKVDEMKTSFMNSQAVGSVSDKVSVTVTIFNVRTMGEYGSILYEGNDDNGNLITFFKNEASKGHFDLDKTYNITGKIKAVGSTPYSYGAIVNTLHYVKVAK